MQSVKFNNIGSLVVSNKSVRGVKMYLALIHNVLNTNFTTNDVKFQFMNLKLILTRGGKSYTLVSDNLRTICAFSNYFNPMFLTALLFTAGKRTIVAKATAVYENLYIPLYFDFGGVINLKGSDTLSVELNLTNGATNATNVNSNSTMNFDFEQGIGYEFGTPYTESAVIQASQNSFSQSLGDNIGDIVLLQLDKTDYLAASQVLLSMSMKSDKYSPNKDYGELITDQAGDFETDATAATRLQSFCLYRKVEQALNGCSVELTLNGNNVTANNNILVWRRYYTDMSLVKIASRRADKHANEFVQKLR